MTAAVDPHDFPTMEITFGPPSKTGALAARSFSAAKQRCSQSPSSPLTGHSSDRQPPLPGEWQQVRQSTERNRGHRPRGGSPLRETHSSLRGG